MLDGNFVDLRDDLYAGSIFRSDNVKANGAGDRQHRSRVHDEPEDVDPGRVEFALTRFSSDCPYLKWLKVAAALRDGLGEYGFTLFDQWSSKATGLAEDGTPKYTPEKAHERWHGARTMRDVGISTVFFFADEADRGWRNRYDEQEQERVLTDLADAAGAPKAETRTATDVDANQTPPTTAAEPDKAQSKTDSIASSDSGGVTADDFYAYMPDHSYIFVPTREMWPAGSVNARVPPVAVLKKDGTAAHGRGGKPKGIKPSTWLDRFRPVEQMTWAPGEPLIIPGRLIAEGGWVERAGVTTFNLYRPPTVRQGNSANADRWLGLVARVYPDDADHIITYCAHRIQFPAVKVNHALLLGGSPGIGKDTMLEPLKHGVGPWNFREVSPQEVMGNYNDFMRCVVLRISEIRDLGEVNRFTFYEHMKTITASPPDVLRVHGKYVPHHCVLNIAGVITTTNHRFDGIYLPADDRRTYVAWSEFLSSDFVEGFWPGLWGWYQAGGLEDVVAYLAEYDLSKFDPKAPPRKTDAFWAIVGAAPEEAELADVLDNLGNWRERQGRRRRNPVLSGGDNTYRGTESSPGRAL